MVLDVRETPQINYKSNKSIHLVQEESKSCICLDTLKEIKKQLFKYYNYLLIKSMLHVIEVMIRERILLVYSYSEELKDNIVFSCYLRLFHSIHFWAGIRLGHH